MGGGASFNHLNGRFTVRDPAGKTPDNAQVLTALRNLKNFIYGFDFLKMRPDKTFILSEVPKGGVLPKHESTRPTICFISAPQQT